MRIKYLIPIVAAIVLLVSCKKDKDDNQTPSPGVQDRGLLKDIVVEKLPSPYYHFEYNNSKQISRIEHNSGLWSYDVSYTSNRLTEMESDGFSDGEKLVYKYDGDKVFLVEYIKATGVIYRRSFLSYSTSGLLEKIEWEMKDVAGFVAERTLSFTYYMDGNVSIKTDRFFEIPAQQQAMTIIDKYENYDNKVNTDDFTLLQNENGGHILLLPGVRLQKNNPGKNTRSGEGIHYKVDYTYTFDAKKRPLTKTGEVLFTNGPDAGSHLTSRTTYSYYE